MTPPAGVAWHDLVPFAVDAGDVALQAGVRRLGGSRVSFSYRIAGTSAVRLPVLAATPARTDGLWEHTCLEAFFAPAGASGYWELNLSPSGDWHCYRFAGYRSGMQVKPRIERPLLEVVRAADTCRLDATLDLSPLGTPAGVALDVGLSAVIERHDGTRSYRALHHGAAQPDFHDRASFVLRLPPARADA